MNFPTATATAHLSLDKSPVGSVERTVTWLITAWVVIVPWLIGGRFWWTQALSTAIGALALFLSLRLRENRRTLWRFPVFWLGLLFNAFVLCQTLNPWAEAIQRRADVYVWDLYLRNHIEWLPSGITGDYFGQSSLRMFVYWLGPWLLTCAWWTGVRRRRSGRRLALIVFLNGIITALVIYYQYIRPPTAVLGFYTDPQFQYDLTLFRSAGFIDRNAAAVLLYLSMSAGMAVACQLQARARKEGRDNGLTWIVLLGCLVILGSFFVLGSRAGLFIGCAVFIVNLFVLIAASLASGVRSPGLWVGSSVLVVGLAVMGFFLITGKGSFTIQRMGYLAAHPEQDTRAILRQETVRMIGPHLWLGWGAGSYRYVSPSYFLADGYFHSKEAYGGLAVRTDYAHSDWLQFPMELGVIGAGIELAILLFWYGYAVKLGRRLGAEGAVILVGCAGMLVNAAVEFPMFNGALIVLFSLLLASAIKTGALEPARIVRR